MLRVAIVGNIASGKTTVEDYLKKKKYPVLDTDEVCHKWLVKADEIKEAFKDYDVFENDEISRDKLGKLVFSNSELKKTLEDILYPYVRVEIARFIAKNKDCKYVFVSIPLLYEAKMEDLFDKVLFVYCDDEIRLKRLISRNHYDEEYAKTRMNAQGSQDEKALKADWVVYNNSVVEELYLQISKLIG